MDALIAILLKSVRETAWFAFVFYMLSFEELFGHPSPGNDNYERYHYSKKGKIISIAIKQFLAHDEEGNNSSSLVKGSVIESVQ